MNQDARSTHLHEYAEKLIEYTNGIAWHIPRWSRDRHPISPRRFDGAEPLVDFGDGFFQDEETTFYFPDVDPGDLEGPLEYRIIANEVDEQRQARGGLAVLAFKARTLQELRSQSIQVWKPTPHLVEVIGGWAANGEVVRFVYGRVGPQHWVSVGGHPVEDKHLEEIDSQRIQVAMGMQFTKHYQWRVYLAFEQWNGIELPTDPVGAREWFRLRDLPEGRSRRAALRHWIEEHWRQNRHDPQEEVQVRKHLRGTETFTWGDLHGHITPSRYDLLQLERLREARNEARRAKTDRRVVTVEGMK